MATTSSPLPGAPMTPVRRAGRYRGPVARTACAVTPHGHVRRAAVRPAAPARGAQEALGGKRSGESAGAHRRDGLDWASKSFFCDFTNRRCDRRFSCIWASVRTNRPSCWSNQAVGRVRAQTVGRFSRYSFYSAKDEGAERRWKINGLGSQNGAPLAHMFFIVNVGVSFQAVGRGFDPRLPLHVFNNLRLPRKTATPNPPS
jgi:hypothetical protein